MISSGMRHILGRLRGPPALIQPLRFILGAIAQEDGVIPFLPAGSEKSRGAPLHLLESF
jgi:hypothetical protein